MGLIVNSFIDTAKRCPEKVMIFDDSSKATFGAIYESAAATASFLIEKGIRGRVLVLAEKDIYIPAVYLACSMSGNAYIPTDPSLPAERLRTIAEISRPDAVIAMSERSAAFCLGLCDNIFLFSDTKNSPADHDAIERIIKETKEEDDMYVIFTSGSTGRPKGVRTSHGALFEYIQAIVSDIGFGEDDVFGNQAPLDYVAAIRDIYIPAYTGAKTYLIPKSMFVLTKNLFPSIEKNGVNTICWVAGAMSLVIKSGAFGSGAPKGIRKILFTGSTLPTADLIEWKKYLPDAIYINHYGPTEATASSTFQVIPDDIDENYVMPIGKCFSNSGVLLLDENGNEVEKGEICIYGRSLSSGYLNNEEMTEKSFGETVHDGKKIRIYHTRDIGYMKDGNLYFGGRLDRQIKFMGHRIEPEEIEGAAASVDGVDDCALIYHKKKDMLILVYTGFAEGRDISLKLREKFPSFMIPRRFERRDGIPKLPGGKTDFVKLGSEYENI